MARADIVRARLAVQQIRQLYEDKGYEKAEVRLIKGGNADDREVIISIFEGPKFKVGADRIRRQQVRRGWRPPDEASQPQTPLRSGSPATTRRTASTMTPASSPIITRATATWA